MSESEYRSVFISEVKEHIVEIFEALGRIDKEGMAGDETLFDLFRRFHTIKGMSNTMGQVNLGEIAHLLEEMLEYIRKNPASLFSFRDLIIKGVNALSIEIDNYERQLPFTSSEIIKELSFVSREIRDKLNLEMQKTDKGRENKVELAGLYETIFEVDSECRTPAVRAFMLLREISSRLKVLHSEPSYQMLKEGIRPSQIKIYTRERPEDALLNDVVKRTGDIKLVGADLFRGKEEQRKVHLVKYVRVPFERIEELTSGLDELLLLWNKYRYSLSEENANPLIGRLEFGFKKVLNYAERLRTVPAMSIIPKLVAMTENTSRTLKKTVKLVVQNENIEIDKSIVDRLEEPLMHIIRNAVYHGIESAEERLENGKHKEGIIEIIFREEEEYIGITVRDDGRGMNREKILKAAREKGLVKSENLTDEDILELVFIPGFSTLNEADMTSGRGFGMDIVRNVLWQMGGDIAIKSIEGEGTEIKLRIPYQFASKKVIIGEISGFKYAFPVAGVRCVLRKNDLTFSEDRKYIGRGEERVGLLNGEYENAAVFIVCSHNGRSIAVGMDDIVFIGETRLYKVPYILKSSKFINSMVVLKGICPVPVISVEYLMDEKNL
ncbi:MAG: ATP-binding protein [Deltaproteobacteria bacterium]|nr:ATP-binding protein [Deltaproteobacteria bacterium]